jgi:hypothetical protein
VATFFARFRHDFVLRGSDWTKDPFPVLEASELWEGNKVFFPTVVRSGDRLAMWYGGSNGGTSALGYAESSDSLVWTRWPANPVLTPLPGCDLVDSSAVIFDGDTAHGWVSNCSDVYHVTAPMVRFADDFETGGTSLWSQVAPEIVSRFRWRRAMKTDPSDSGGTGADPCCARAPPLDTVTPKIDQPTPCAEGERP